MLSSYFWAKTTVSNTTSHNGLFCSLEWHSHMTDIANTYQTSTLNQMSTDGNKHLQTAEQTIIREGANRGSLRWTSSGCCWVRLLRHRHSGRLTARAVVRSQGPWRLDERASPKGANGNVLNLKHQPLCQNHRGRGGERVRKKQTLNHSCLSRQRGSWWWQHVLFFTVIARG